MASIAQLAASFSNLVVPPTSTTDAIETAKKIAFEDGIARRGVAVRSEGNADCSVEFSSNYTPVLPNKP